MVCRISLINRKIRSVFNILTRSELLLGLGDCTRQPRYAGREEIFSTLRDDEDTHRDRRQRTQGIKSNHAPSSLTNQWIETVKVVSHHCYRWMKHHLPWRRCRVSERREFRTVRPR
jgi:hypothetical protein